YVKTCRRNLYYAGNIIIGTICFALSARAGYLATLHRLAANDKRRAAARRHVEMLHELFPDGDFNSMIGDEVFADLVGPEMSATQIGVLTELIQYAFLHYLDIGGY